jgi:hypothetical protein
MQSARRLTTPVPGGHPAWVPSWSLVCAAAGAMTRKNRQKHRQNDRQFAPLSPGVRARILPPQRSHTSMRKRPLGVRPASTRRWPPRRAARCPSRTVMARPRPPRPASCTRIPGGVPRPRTEVCPAALPARTRSRCVMPPATPTPRPTRARRPTLDTVQDVDKAANPGGTAAYCRSNCRCFCRFFLVMAPAAAHTSVVATVWLCARRPCSMLLSLPGCRTTGNQTSSRS